MRARAEEEEEEVESPCVRRRRFEIVAGRSVSLSSPFLFSSFFISHSLKLVSRDVEEEPRAQVIEQFQRYADHF